MSEHASQASGLDIVYCDECLVPTGHVWKDSWTERELCDACVRRATYMVPEGAM